MPSSVTKTDKSSFCSRYNAGHLIEGALAHRLYYKNDEMMTPILKYVDLLAATLGDKEGQIPGYPGHPEIELALLRLYKVTGDPKHVKLALFFVEERGNANGGKRKDTTTMLKQRLEGKASTTYPCTTLLQEAIGMIRPLPKDKAILTI